MRHQRLIAVVTCIALVAMLAWSNVAIAQTKGMIGINVLLKTDVTQAILSDLSKHGTVRDVVAEIKAVTMQAKAAELAAIQALPYVASANPDAERKAGPVEAALATSPLGGISTWDLDAINVTDYGAGRTIGYDGTDVYVAVLDTGLVSNWKSYFPADRIDTAHAICFGGGGGENGNVSTPTNKWATDQNSHGTHVTSTILGYYAVTGTYTGLVNGVAPMATIIPVKVLNQNGSGWSSVIARGIDYITDLKIGGDLGTKPVVINMSLGGPSLDDMEKAAIIRAVANGVIIVASAGNEGASGMGYPGAYAPVISVAASGWVGEWTTPPAGTRWWYGIDVPDPTNPDDFYITDFSSRQLDEQDLDVAAPGSWILGSYQTNGQINYYYLGGTSMASPHVAGIVALMAQKYPTLTPAEAEDILEDTAFSLGVGPRTINGPSGVQEVVDWGTNATGAGLVDAAAALAATP